MSIHQGTRPDTPPLEFKARASAVMDRWLSFWFKPTDLTTLGVMRICAGLLYTYILLVYSFNLQTLLGKDAWVNMETMRKLHDDQPVWKEPADWYGFKSIPLPDDPEKRAELNHYVAEWETDRRFTYTRGTPVWSIWYHVTDPTWMAIVHGLIILTTVLFTIGLCTRVTGVLVWVASVSYVNRAVSSFFGMDTMMNLLLLYLMVGSVCGASGGALSVDRWLAGWWGRRWGNAKTDPGPSPLARVAGNFVIRMVQINFCIIYLASGLSKLQGSSWWNGWAMWGVMANPEFNPLDFPPYMQYLIFLCQHRWLWEIAMHAGVLFTLSLEISFAYLIWLPRWRWIMIIGAVMLHTGIALVMGLVGFSLSMLTLLLAFVPPETVRRMVNTIKNEVRPLFERLMRMPESEKASVAFSR